MIELLGVTLEIAGRPLLTDVDTRFDSGRVTALLGPNGAGKTTLLRAIAGLHPVARGNVALNERPLVRMTPLERARLIALVTADDVMLDALSVRDVVAIGRFAYHRWWQWRSREDDDTAVDRALDSVGMQDFAKRLFSTLSSGERQRVWIALGLAQETEILLLDEPTSHLDVRVAHEILELLRRFAHAGKTIVCALHDLNEAAAYADGIALLGNGRMLAFAATETLLADARLEAAYRIGMERVRLPGGGLRVFASGGGDGSWARAEHRN